MKATWIKLTFYLLWLPYNPSLAQDTCVWVGRSMPAIEAIRIDSQKVNLDIVANQWYIVDFWASWCDPCIVNNRELQDLYKHYADQGLKIISISLDKDWSSVVKMLKREKYSWKNFWVLPESFKNKTAVKLCITHVPTSFLVDKKGIIRARGNNLSDIERVLKKELKEYTSDF